VSQEDPGRTMKCSAKKEPTQFVEGEIDGVRVEQLEPHLDDRGWLVELYRGDELPADDLPVMAYVSQTQPGMTRGPHEHREQTDVFTFLGEGRWRVYLWDARPGSLTWGHRRRVEVERGAAVQILVPPGVVHAYRNLGTTPAWVFNAANRLYAGEGRASAVDEIRHEGRPGSPYVMD
jgi:dTDP-4-dehydrorhamnose 3,5-epimerase